MANDTTVNGTYTTTKFPTLVYAVCTTNWITITPALNDTIKATYVGAINAADGSTHCPSVLIKAYIHTIWCTHLLSLHNPSNRLCFTRLITTTFESSVRQSYIRYEIYTTYNIYQLLEYNKCIREYE